VYYEVIKASRKNLVSYRALGVKKGGGEKKKKEGGGGGDPAEPLSQFNQISTQSGVGIEWMVEIPRLS
jgi:hypothetical protein